MTALTQPVLVPDLKNDGSVRDLANPSPDDFTWEEMANGLSKIARFNGRYSCAAYPVGQHLVMGADAIFVETGDPIIAAYFLLHDAHEFFIGDVTRPTLNLIEFHMRPWGPMKTEEAWLNRLDRFLGIDERMA